MEKDAENNLDNNKFYEDEDIDKNIGDEIKKKIVTNNNNFNIIIIK